MRAGGQAKITALFRSTFGFNQIFNHPKAVSIRGRAADVFVAKVGYGMPHREPSYFGRRKRRETSVAGLQFAFGSFT